MQADTQDSESNPIYLLAAVESHNVHLTVPPSNLQALQFGILVEQLAHTL